MLILIKFIQQGGIKRAEEKAIKAYFAGKTGKSSRVAKNDAKPAR